MKSENASTQTTESAGSKPVEQEVVGVISRAGGGSPPQNRIAVPVAVCERDHEMAEQWWSDNFDDPATNEELSALWILCHVLARARAEGPRDPSPGYQPKWRTERADDK